ncbi:hypothetical protein A3207_05735 [Candidatus Methanomassiliicoccus intestinalis]|jgi:hypothetical protein|nr:MAG: hypothetical protein A3206_03775 [Candidatus Methanomassiliicoccus intestinalis]TQS84339.1 MAG: hypothetical protein A3207_05735 [Candidatus Methanomassiliicoccus intestinalis]
MKAAMNISLEEKYKIVSGVLGENRYTTLELEAAMADQGTQCPDDLARTLNVLKRKGMICGEVSTERGGWVWWIENNKE